MVQEILRGKALARIVETASVKDASGNVVELKNLRPDGSIGEPEAETAAEEPADEETSADRERRSQLFAAVDPELGVDASEVVLDGLGAQEEQPRPPSWWRCAAPRSRAICSSCWASSSMSRSP